MRFAKLFVLLVVAAALVGCSNSGPAPVTVTPAPTPAKKILEEIATTGAITSGVVEVESSLNDLRSTDAAKAEKLSKELSELKAMKDPAQIKAKAKAMAAQL